MGPTCHLQHQCVGLGSPYLDSTVWQSVKNLTLLFEVSQPCSTISTVDLNATFQKEARMTAFRFDARQGIIRAARTEESWAMLNEEQSENPFRFVIYEKI